MYFYVTVMMNIGTNYSTLLLTIQKNWKDKNTNLVEAMLQIIRYFEFLEGNKKTCNVMQTSNLDLLINHVPKNACTNLKCVKKGLQPTVLIAIRYSI